MKQELTPIELSVLKTIAYFDIFDWPLTLFELWQNLASVFNGPMTEGVENLTPDELLNQIEQSAFLSKVLDKNSNLFFLKGREGLLRRRNAAYREAFRKIKKTLRLARFLKYIPFVKGIALCNTASYGNAKKESDIDLAILVETGRIWTTRLLTVLITEILANRPSPAKTSDTFCLSFYAALDVNIAYLRLKPNDPCFDWWLARFFPLYNYPNSFETFFDNNRWIFKKYPRLCPAVSSFRTRSDFPSRKLLKIFRFILSFPSAKLTEEIARNVQLFRMPKNLKNASAENSTDVVINNQVLKLHLKDKRKFYRHEFEKRLGAILEGNCG